MILGITAQSGTSGSSSGPTEDAYFLNVAFQIEAVGQSDGTGYSADESRHAHALTYSGTATILSGKFEFDGSGAIFAPPRALWYPGSRLTIECFGVQFDSYASNFRTLAACYDTSGNHRTWLFGVQATGVLEFFVSSNGSSTSSLASYSFSPATDGTEYDIGFSWDGTNCSLYVDGVQVATGTYDGTAYQNGESLTIGASQFGGSLENTFDGRMKAVRITRGYDRTGQAASYTPDTLPLVTTQSTTTDPDWDKVVLLLDALTGGEIRDASPYDWPVSVVSTAAVSTGVQPISGVNSISFNGSSDRLLIPDDPDLEFGGSDFTIEHWARHAVNTAQHTYISKYSGGGNLRSLWLRYDGVAATDNLNLIMDDNGASPVAINQTNPWTPTVDTFYHVAICRNSSTHRDFVDGSQIGSDQTISISAYDGTAPLSIGAGDSAGYTQFMNGYLSELRITIGKGRYTAGFSAPTAAFPRG